jgi:hypothetical protein
MWGSTNWNRFIVPVGTEQIADPARDSIRVSKHIANTIKNLYFKPFIPISGKPDYRSRSEDNHGTHFFAIFFHDCEIGKSILTVVSNKGNERKQR